jgi:hypothetical protein
VHHFGFIILIYYDARSTKHKIGVLKQRYILSCGNSSILIFTLAYTIFRCVISSYVTVLVLSVKHNYHNLLVSLFVYQFTCFEHLFGHHQAILCVCIFCLHYYIYNTLISTLQTRSVIRDLIFCSTGKLLVTMGSLQFLGLLFFSFFYLLLWVAFCLLVLIRLVTVRLSCRISIWSLTLGFSYLWCFRLRAGADPSVCIRVGTCVVIAHI